MPETAAKGPISCLQCSFDFRSQSWWRKRRYQALVIAAAVVVFLGSFMLYRWRSNAALAKELRAEFDAWLESLPQVPDSENGMPLLMQGIKPFYNYQNYNRLGAEDFSLKNKADLALVQSDLGAYKGALDLIYKGLKYKKFQYGTDWSKGPGADIPNLLAFKTVARLISLNGEIAQSQGRQTLALEEYLNTLRLGRTLANERGVISAMIEVAVLQIGFKPLLRNLSLHWLTHEELEYVLKELKELHGRGGDFSKVLETEYYAGFAWIVQRMAAGEINFKDLGMGPNPLISTVFSRFIHNYRADMETFRKWLDICRKTDPANYWSMPPEWKDSDVFLEYFDIRPGELSLPSVLLPNLLESAKCVTETEVLWRGAIALTAVRLYQATHGRLPKDLAELGGLVSKDLLTDPFSGKDMIYYVKGDDFYLYSAGYNGVDDKGTRQAPFYKPGFEYPENTSDYVIHAPWPQKK